MRRPKSSTDEAASKNEFSFYKMSPHKDLILGEIQTLFSNKYKHSLMKKYNFGWCYGQQTQFQEEMWFTWEMRNLSNLICQRRETWIGLTFGCMRTSYMWSVSSDIAKFHEYFKWHFSHFAFPFMKPLTFAFMKKRPTSQPEALLISWNRSSDWLLGTFEFGWPKVFSWSCKKGLFLALVGIDCHYRFKLGCSFEQNSCWRTSKQIWLHIV